MIQHAQKLLLACAVSSLGLLSACGGGGGSTGVAPSQQFGTLQVGLTDAPACGFDQVNVTVAKVRVNQSASASETDAGWTDITLNPARKINLLSLANGVLDPLGQTPLTPGHYSQLRLVLAANSSATPMANSVVPTGGTEKALETPSGVQSGIKLTHEFDVAANTLVDLTLDFDACKSVVARGNGVYALKPVVSVVPMVVSGGITGIVDPALASSKPVISAQQNGAVVKTTVPDANGNFTLAPIAAGTYAVVVTADARATNVITNVPVVAKANTAVSSAAFPMVMQASTMATVSGTALPATAEASIKASQSFATGPTVQIQYGTAAATTGQYSLSLPVAAPLIGQYSPTMPIALVPTITSAGKYTIDVSATGYQSQSAAVDVILANAVKNFTLVP